MIPADPTILVTVVVTVALVLFIGIICFFALAPVVSDTWADRLDPGSTHSFDTEAQHGD